MNECFQDHIRILKLLIDLILVEITCDFLILKIKKWK